MDRSPRRRPPATLASLAAELGISRTTVSNAYNRPEQLSSQLRTRILETARSLGYPGPDPTARSLRTKKAGAVGLVLADPISYAVRDPVAVSLLAGLADECDRARTALMLVPANPDAEDVAGVVSAAVDGFLAFAMSDDDPHLHAVLARNVPVVICDQPLLPDVDLVGVDDAAAMAEIAGHLLDLGHRRIGVACLRLGRRHRDGPVDLDRQQRAHYHVQRNRLAGLRDTFTAAGVAWDRVPVVERFVNSTESGASAAAELLALDPGSDRDHCAHRRARPRRARRACPAAPSSARGRQRDRVRRNQGRAGARRHHRLPAVHRKGPGGGQVALGPQGAGPERDMCCCPRNFARAARRRRSGTDRAQAPVPGVAQRLGSEHVLGDHRRMHVAAPAIDMTHLLRDGSR